MSFYLWLGEAAGSKDRWHAFWLTLLKGLSQLLRCLPAVIHCLWCVDEQCNAVLSLETIRSLQQELLNRQACGEQLQRQHVNRATPAGMQTQ